MFSFAVNIMQDYVFNVTIGLFPFLSLSHTDLSIPVHERCIELKYEFMFC